MYDMINIIRLKKNSTIYLILHHLYIWYSPPLFRVALYTLKRIEKWILIKINIR